MRKALIEDISLLIELMASFYTESGNTLDHSLAEKAFAALLSKEHLGCVWLIDEGGQPAGSYCTVFKTGVICNENVTKWKCILNW